jgi:hypothetical protein
MTMTRAWWIVAGGMILAVPGTVALAVINQALDVHHDLRYPFLLGCAIAAVGVVLVTRVAVRALGR